MRSDTYEMTFTGRADKTLCTVRRLQRHHRPGCDHSPAGLPSLAAVSELVQRIAGLGFEVVDLHRGTPPSALVKIMRITGLDRGLHAFQVPEQAASLRLP